MANFGGGNFGGNFGSNFGSNFGGLGGNQNFIGYNGLGENGQLGNNALANEFSGLGYNNLAGNGQLGNSAGLGGFNGLGIYNGLQGNFDLANNTHQFANGTNFNMERVYTPIALRTPECPAGCFASMPWDPCNTIPKWCPRGCCPLYF